MSLTKLRGSGLDPQRADREYAVSCPSRRQRLFGYVYCPIYMISTWHVICCNFNVNVNFNVNANVNVNSLLISKEQCLM